MSEAAIRLARRPADPSVSARDEFADVYAEHWVHMVRLACLTTGSVAIAEEIVQEAFVGLHRNFDRVEHPVGWLRVAVVNGCRDWVRRRAREPMLILAVNWDDGADGADVLTIRQALDSLTPRQRAAVVLRYFEDLPEREIADVLGCRRGTVKSLLSRGLTQLAKELGA